MFAVPGPRVNEYSCCAPLVSVHVTVSTKGGVSPLTSTENDPLAADVVVLTRAGIDASVRVTVPTTGAPEAATPFTCCVWFDEICWTPQATSIRMHKDTVPAMIIVFSFFFIFPSLW